MKKLLLLSPLSSTQCVKPTILRLSAQFAASITTAVADSDPSEDNQEVDSSLIIQEKDLLRKSDKTQLGLHVLDLIDAGALEPTSQIYSCLLKKCTQLKKLKEGSVIHKHLLNSRFKDDIFFQNAIVNLYCKCGSLEDARKTFEEMPNRDMVTWTALITGYAQNDRPNEALELFPRMLELGLMPNGFTFASVFKASGASSWDRIGEQIHALCIKYGCDLDVYVGSALLDMYARHGKMDEACTVFDWLDSKNEISWNALIAGYARQDDGKNAIKKFSEMQRNCFGATHFTYSSVFSVCASTGALEQGKWVHAHMVKSGQKLTAFVGNTLLDMYGKAGSIDDARKVFDRLDKKDVVSWNSMLTAFAQHGLGKEAVRLFEEMRRFGVQPNQITFLCVLTACSHGGLLREGKYYFELMKKYKVEPEVDHYVTIVDLLGRAGHLDQAHDFIKKMPIRPTAAVWGALLGSCRMHRNAELGQFAAKHVFELDPHDAGPHVLLYNIYASAGRWDDAAKVRKMMKESKVKKEPACSWVEIENSVHMFVANDESHPQIKEIYKMWDNINGKIKEEGYIPDTGYVLLHVDEQEREAKLQYHSEKIALAFALLNMPPGATIRIMKNIRMCGDCHCAIKYVSKVTQREIIVRDTNRFHHFSNGSCSCGDYW
ncbi:pentatricopeptide repeat-containing protein At3g24000, mitochondrial [Typha angustifolia]|uniref:pentatricopeptide repeat-containing protein At3g24000, mitochondrial n=1 Tax=Typha angustifolia TaxID=59011 RepID=UPI003C2B454C